MLRFATFPATLLLLCFVLVLPSQAATAPGRRVALLIGNSNYEIGRLQFPARDVEVMQTALLAIGFNHADVVVVRDASRQAMSAALQDFSNRAKGAEIALLYYSGHATQALGSNWLIPVGAQIRSESGFQLEAVSAQDVLDQITAARAKIGILVLDACRDSPTSFSKSATKGLARMDAGSNTLIAFATAAGDTAQDNGLYARTLAEQLVKPGQELVDVFRSTAEAVALHSNNLQIPAIGELKLTQRVFLAGPPLPANFTATTVIARNTVLDDEKFETAVDGVSLLLEAFKAGKSLATLEAMAAADDPQAAYLVGVARMTGIQTPLDYASARAYLKRAMDLQFLRAQFAYGSMLYDGLGGPENRKDALELWQAGALRKFSPSMMRLAYYYAYDAPPAERRPDKARELYRRASIDTPDAWAMLAAMTLDGVGQPADTKAGMQLMADAAAKQSLTANLRMARFERWGVNVPKDINAAMKHYAKAAELDSTDAMTDLGVLLTEGTEVPKDVELGIQYLERASAHANRTADSLLVKAYVSQPSRMPKGWPLRAKAVAAAQAGQLEGLVRLVGAYRDGDAGFTRDWQEVGGLSRIGLDLVAKAAPDSESAWPVFAYGLGRARIRAAEEGGVQVPTAELAELKRLWSPNKVLKRFTVQIVCAGKSSPFDLYIWDATGKNSPTDAQFEWARAAHACTVSKEIIEPFQKLYRISQENNVSFTELAAYAFSRNHDSAPGASTAAAARPAPPAGAGVAPVAPAAAYAGSGLDGLIQEIGHYERVKLRAAAKLQPGLADDQALDRWIAALDSATSQPDAVQDSCPASTVLGQERSKKAGESANVIKLDLFCQGSLNAYLLLPDDPRREVTLFVRTRKAGSGPGSDFGTRYVISRTDGVLKSWHDIDGDGRPDSFGFHLGGHAQPTKTLALTTSAL